MPQRKRCPRFLKDLPSNWTMADIEARLPKSWRRQRRIYKVTLHRPPAPGVPEKVTYLANLNLDERDRVKVEYGKLIREGLLFGFTIFEEPPFRVDMCLMMADTIRGRK
jgi:hypothetical protein